MTVEELLVAMSDFHIFNMYKEDLELKNVFFSELEHLKDSWDCYADLPDRQVYTKAEPGEGLVSVFYRFQCPTNIFYPVALLSEIDMFKEWVPNMQKSEVIKSITDLRKVIYFLRDFPWPLASREMVVCASAILIKEKKGILTMIRSVNDIRA